MPVDCVLGSHADVGPGGSGDVGGADSPVDFTSLPSLHFRRVHPSKNSEHSVQNGPYSSPQHTGALPVSWELFIPAQAPPIRAPKNSTRGTAYSPSGLWCDLDQVHGREVGASCLFLSLRLHQCGSYAW